MEKLRKVDISIYSGSPAETEFDLSKQTDEITSSFINDYLIKTIRSAFGVSSKSRNPKPCSDAMQWLLSDVGNAPFSIQECCEVIGLDSEELQSLIKYYSRTKRKVNLVRLLNSKNK